MLNFNLAINWSELPLEASFWWNVYIYNYIFTFQMTPFLFELFENLKAQNGPYFLAIFDFSDFGETDLEHSRVWNCLKLGIQTLQS